MKMTTGWWVLICSVLIAHIAIVQERGGRTGVLKEVLAPNTFGRWGQEIGNDSGSITTSGPALPTITVSSPGWKLERRTTRHLRRSRPPGLVFGIQPAPWHLRARRVSGQLGRVHTNRSASTIRAKDKKPRNKVSSFSNREKMRRKPLSLRNRRSISLRFL